VRELGCKVATPAEARKITWPARKYMPGNDVSETHMLHILGNAKRCCNGVSRRDFLRAGGLGLVGLGVGGVPGGSPAPAAARHAPGSFGKAKSLLILYLYGAPSQIDTFDPKPGAPVEARGEFGTIATNLPGVRVCEHLPRIARQLHRIALVRSMSHHFNNHAVAYTLSGIPSSEPAIEANAREPRHWPYLGSMLDYLWTRRAREAARSAVPCNLYLPWPLNSRTKNAMHGGLNAAWLGSAFDPVVPQFAGRASREVGAPSADGSEAIRSRFDPYDGVTPDSKFELPATQLAPQVTLDRLDRRRTLLQQLDQQQRRLEGQAHSFNGLRQSAFDMVLSPRINEALDVTREPDRMREKFGYTLFGQGALAARRLIEVGARVVTVFWDEHGPVNTAWDTHTNNFPRLKEGLCPTLDQVYPALLDDLDQRGLLAETLVLLLSEHGRTPRIANGVPGGGREHWSYAYCGAFAGAGIAAGKVIGATDRQGGYPSDRPINPKDVLATVYHLLGFDPEATTTPDRLGRPMSLLPHGEVISELLA